ncbi:hypothetical protein D7X55_32720 [Corallococcus sp. AB049A]|uniref:hypothetical protein n=1 Tax=Corallococcus sp. AB049A TaxID=2316721 RepID=UPI000EC8C634|nr:hypothetical protein [Corallococcus sp. AB049A]RKI52235.1 hypothetical protein D7X55_32720 [Corallococcus sp. AB049A]
MSKVAVVTFDLSRENHDYKTAYKILGDLGLHTTDPSGKLYMPSTTVMGQVADSWTSVSLRQRILTDFIAAGVNLESILCVMAADFAGIGEPIQKRTEVFPFGLGG